MQYPSFNWWQGVVEDRLDPEKIGRVKVRILGHHTEDKNVLPTEDLPFAQVLQPIQSAAISGIGHSATGIVEGTHVVGFFADGSDAQIPVILGTLGGFPIAPADESKGFNDPSGTYPRYDLESGLNTVPESDISRLAREEMAEKHKSLIFKRGAKVEGVPIAFAPELLIGKILGARYEESTWNEPDPQGTKETKSKYPYNHVHETESGHVFEIDDTPGAERLNRQHKIGTFEEIQPDGTRVSKVMGDDYEIVVKNKNVFIKGSVNVTVEGDATFNVKGDKYEDITGNSFTIVRGDRHTKIQGNEVIEVMSDMSTIVEGSRDTQIRARGGTGVPNTGSDTLVVKGRMQTDVGKDYKINTVEKFSVSAITGIKLLSSLGTFSVYSLRDLNFGTSTLSDISFSSGGFNIGASLNMNVDVGLVKTETVLGSSIYVVPSTTWTGIINHIGANNQTGNHTVLGTVSGTVVSQGTTILGTHVHAITSGSSAGTTAPPT